MRYEDIWLSSEVLPIVCVHALRLIVLLIEWTPLSFEEKHVKVSILLHVMNQPRFKVFGTVSERAVITVLAFAQILGILGAILRLVLLWMVHTLYSIMRDKWVVETLFALTKIWSV